MTRLHGARGNVRIPPRVLPFVACAVACAVLLPIEGHAENRASTAVRAITLPELRAHVEELAHDRYAGRETLFAGCDLARDYIAARFQEYGLAPAPGQAGYAVEYSLFRMSLDRKQTVLEVASKTAKQSFEVGVDFTPFPFSDEAAVDAEVCFAGYGIRAEAEGHDDYAGLDVTGKFVLLLRHVPREAVAGNPLAGSRHGLFATKAEVARKQGAAGMLLVTDPNNGHPPDDFRLQEFLAVEPPQMNGQGARSDTGFVALHISPKAAQALLASTGKSLVEIQRAIDGGATAKEFALSGVRARGSVRRMAEPEELRPHNVVGCLIGSHPERSKEWVILGAHYDHVGAYPGAPGSDTIFNGADDNASGTAGLLEIAQAFAARESRPERSVAFVAFSGEEKGLLGSRAFVEQTVLPMDHTVFMLNLDMIGRNPERPLEVCGEAFVDGLREIVDESNRTERLELAYQGTNYAANSDHDSFYKRGIPFSFFFTGLHEDYHQVGDHADKIAYERMVKICRLAYGVLDRIANRADAPALIHDIAWLGAELRLRREQGLGRAVFVRIEPDGVAAKCGLRAGDELLAAGDLHIEGDQQLASAIGAIAPGGSATLRIARGDERLEVPVRRNKTGFLGISSQPVPQEDRTRLALKPNEGVWIAQVIEGAPAAKAGLERGDILLAIARHPVDPASLIGVLQRIGAGEAVDVQYVRNGERRQARLTLAERSGE